MRTEQSSSLMRLLIAAADLSLLTASFFVSYWLRFGGYEKLDEFIWLFYITAPLLILALNAARAFTSIRQYTLLQILRSCFIAFLAVGVLSMTLMYLTKTDYSRLLLGYYFLFSFSAIVLEKAFLKALFDLYTRKGGMNIRVALIGSGEKFQDILQQLRGSPERGIRPVLVLENQGQDVDQVITDVRNSVIDEVYIAYPRRLESQAFVEQLISRLENLGLPIRVSLNYDELENYYGQQFCLMAGKSGVLLEPYNLNPDQLIIKRIIDVLGSVIGLCIFAVVIPIVGTLIKIESAGPIFFSQVRVGKGGRLFRIYKFRSMYVDAESRKQELLEGNIHQGPIFKMVDDPRVTRVGRFIRKYSIDELPQFINVFLGHMSLVGTRPPLPEEVREYEEHHHRRISIKPGITGIWQTSGRNEIMEFEDVVELETEYIKNWGLLLDLKIILKTLGVVLFPGSRAM